MVIQGHKQTPIGTIPNDWECVSLLSKCELLNGLTYTPNDVADNGLLVIRSSNIQNNQLVFQDNVYVNLIVSNEKLIKKDDIIICVRNGSVSLIGKCAKASRDYPITFGAFMAVLRGENNGFVYQILQQGMIQKCVRKNSGATINQITNGDFKTIFVPFPTDLKEQKRITEALSDMDSMVSALEKLVEKKKAIKQGAMHELLTGKKRLPGFSGAWISGKWKDVLDCFSSGATPYRGNSEYYKGRIKWVSSGELNYNYILDTVEHISYDAQVKTNLTVHPAGTFLMAITGLEAAGTRGSCAILGTSATTNQSCMAIYGTEKMSTEYLFHYYVQNGDALAIQYCQGTKQQSYTAAIVKELPIYYPEDIAEQIAISSVLFDMDNEIETLEQKLAKTRQIKQGMMQQLLTGKIRLIDTESADASVVQNNDVVSVQSKHNHQFDDAVMIAGIVNSFYSDKYFLGRKKVQKLLYLVRRKQEADVSSFKKKAAGPYADEVRYKGGEPIAKKNKYIFTSTTKDGTCFSKGSKIDDALKYIEKWQIQNYIDWLYSTFRFCKVDELELYATVDMAICDLQNSGIDVNVASVKDLISSNSQWKNKLSKKFFSDEHIERAICKCNELFGS